jgi:hypothetical protein
MERECHYLSGKGLFPVAKLYLQPRQEIAQDLVFAFPVMLVARLAEKGAQFVFAHAEVGQLQNGQHVLGLQVQCDFQFHENHVVGQAGFRLRLRAGLFAAQGIDKTIEKDCQGAVVALLEGRIVIFFQPVADLLPGHGLAGFGEDTDHAAIVKVEDIASAAQNVIIEHGKPVVSGRRGRGAHVTGNR